jgi:hypothetical protein
MEDFIGYLKSIWGKLSVVSIFFPFAGKLIGTFETPDPFWPSNKTAILVLTSIASAFVIFLLYVQRYETSYSVLTVIFIFILGIILSFNYLDNYSCTNIGCTLVYFGIFICFTGSFTMLAIKDRYQ